MQRVALWARVSSDEQTPSTQLVPLRSLAKQLGGEVVREFVLHESATGKRGRRKEFEEMLTAAARREFDGLLFYNLSRFSREGIRKTIIYLQRLEACGVWYKSYQEPMLDTENELVRHVVTGLLAYLAEYQAQQISEATTRKLASLKAQGVQLGRPTRYIELRPALRAMVQEGATKTEIARRLKVSYNTMMKYLERLEQEQERGLFK